MDNLVNYYKGWPCKGHYFNTMNKIYSLLYKYLTSFNGNLNKYTVIFDIDDTIVFTDNQNLFPNKKFPYNWIKGFMLFPPIPQIVSIVHLCKKLGFKIIIITARPYESEESSKKNLEILKISYDQIYHNNNYPDLNFKINLKKKLNISNNIILCVGDQWPDILGLNNCLCVKLPSYQDKKAFYTFNNINYYQI